ncbi:MAG: preprotein translocase subunit SecE [Firmicutes bacterium]|nr:preprotein translocase subunit SecE [Alicyclobacillaceae bacterium]MCL6497945.1 preprotein translocase subunit SecE [Bacillota bacterium]
MEAKNSTVNTASERSRRFLKDVRAELRKVLWPTPRQTAQYTGTVVAATILVGLIIMGLDAIFNLGLQQFVR